MTLDQLISNYEKDVEFYRNEIRMGDEAEKLAFSEAKQICQRVVHDLKQLQKDLDGLSTHTP